jgi:hypothetical protein
MDVAVELAKLHVTLWVVPKDSESAVIIETYKVALRNVLYSRQYKGVC